MSGESVGRILLIIELFRQKVSRQALKLLQGLCFLLSFSSAAWALPGDLVDSGQSLGNSHSRCVALGDLDGDGDLDAFVVNDLGEANRVYINDGAGSFTDSGQSLGTASSQGVALGDLDGDDDLDAFVANLGPNRIYLNDGSGVFTDSGALLGSRGSTGVALGLLDGDSDLDAFVINGYEQPDRVYLNDGSGIFTDSGQELGAAHGRTVALGDLDGDSDLDAYVSYLHYYIGDTANDPKIQPDTVYLNDGGTFTDSGQLLGTFLTSVALGDVDDDGDLDAFAAIFWTEYKQSPHRTYLNDSSGAFADSGLSFGISDAGAVALGDLDSDGDLDALVANFHYQAHLILENDGDGNFTDSGRDLGSSNGTGVALGDLDGDDDLDAFMTNGSGQGNRVFTNDPL